jgi:hypothetical protein
MTDPETAPNAVDTGNDRFPSEAKIIQNGSCPLRQRRPR